MRLSLIAALTPDRVIGKNNQLPWHMPADLQYFKKVTLNKALIMGRKTFESIGKPLPNRKNIIITRNPHFKTPESCLTFDSIDAALKHLTFENEVFVIGGAEIFTQTLPLANRLYLTFIEADISGDTYFPAWHQNDWQEIWREAHLKDEKNMCPYHFVILDRI